MGFRLSTWRPKHLLWSWCGYWVLLVLGGIARAIPPLMRVSAPDAKGSASISFGDAGLKLVVTEGATEMWSMVIGVMPLTLAAVIPPLLLWAAWLWSQRKRPAEAGASAR